MKDKVKGVIQSERMTPVISFYTIFDCDFGIINLVGSKYCNGTIFDNSYLKDKKLLDIIVNLYGREERNPLYCLGVGGVDQKTLDRYYQEFYIQQEKEIYSHSITTSVLNMIGSFNESQSIKTSILCYNDLQVQFVKDEPELLPCHILMKEELEKEIVVNSFDQYFFKDVEEAEFIKDKIESKSIYFSSYGPNIRENDLVRQDIINDLIKRNNQINLFDVYNSYILGGVQPE